MQLPPDVAAFRAAWLPASKVEATERPNATVQRALDRLAAGVRVRVLRGENDDDAVKPFAKVVNPSMKFQYETAPTTLLASTLRDGDRLLVDVCIGAADAVYAFDAAGRKLPLPTALRQSNGFRGDFHRIGKLILRDAYSIQDMSELYALRLSFVRRTAQGYMSAGTVEGVTNYDNDPRLVVKGDKAVVRSLDHPRSFFTSRATPLLRRTETWDASGPTARRVAVRLEDLNVRAADNWLASHIGTRLGKAFTVQKDNGMANEVQRGKGWLILDLEGAKLRFELATVNGKVVVRRVTSL